jgi:uncharacterized membrane protein
MQVTDAPRRHVSTRQLAWLEREAKQWQDAAIIDSTVRDAIVGQYTAASDARRGMLALILVAVGMCSVGVLLLIGYNWDQIPRAARLALVVGAVAAAFGASAVACARRRLVVAETLAFFGALLFGNAIWLVAQILHIEGRYPDAFLWWAGGVLVSAWLVRSQWVGALGSALVLVWVAAEGELTAAPSLQFLLLWPLALAVAYSLRSSLMVRIVAPAAALWVFFGGMDNSHSALWLGSIALTGCAMYSLGRWHEPDGRTRRAWEASGLIVLLLVFIPLMITGVHRDIAPGGGTWLVTIVAVVATVAAGAASVRPSRTFADDGVLATAAATAVWTLASWSGLSGSTTGFVMAATVLFSVLALVLAVSLIRTALSTGRVADLAAGVLFAVVFLGVRWTSVIENLLWSGLLLVVAGAGLLAIAQLWRGRAPRAAGRVS